MDEKSKFNAISKDFQSQSQVSKQHSRAKSQVWDCGSSLYDSFELQSLKRQLNSAIIASSRSYSMPHLTHHRAPPPPPPEAADDSGIKSSKIARSFQKLLRSVFRPSNRSSGPETEIGSLRTIPEASNFNCSVIHPAINAIARKAVSARFSDLSCA